MIPKAAMEMDDMAKVYAFPEKQASVCYDVKGLMRVAPEKRAARMERDANRLASALHYRGVDPAHRSLAYARVRK
jgi:hypothetical protein